MKAALRIPEGLHEGALVAGKYRVGRPLGAGGMGLVLAAVHEALGTHVALKVIHRESLRDPSLPARFVQEGRAAATLKSEHVVRVHDLGTLEDGTPYLAMEHLEGVDLGALLEEKPRLAFDEAVEIVRQTCDALSEAHAAGIVHRDLKPQNLFLVQRPGKTVHVKVLDFGIAKFLSQEHLQLHIATHSTAIMGSPIYMAPEQMRAAKAADGRSDLWSLGVIFYQLLVGKVPFEAESLPELCAMVLTEKAPAIDPEALGIPEGIRDVVAKLLQTDPAARYQTADDILEALSPYVTTKPIVVAEIGKLVSARALEPAPVQSARITPQGNGNDIRPDGATMPAVPRGTGNDVKTVFDKGSKSGSTDPGIPVDATPIEDPPPTVQSGTGAGRTRTASTTTQRRLRKTIAEVLAENDDLKPAGVPAESGNGRALLGLLLLALGAGGGLYMWKFHKAPFAPLQQTVAPTPSGSTKPRSDDNGSKIPLHPASSSDPAPRASTPAAGGGAIKPHDPRTAVDAGKPTAPVQDASVPTPPVPVEHLDAGGGGEAPAP